LVDGAGIVWGVCQATTAFVYYFTGRGVMLALFGHLIRAEVDDTGTRKHMAHDTHDIRHTRHTHGTHGAAADIVVLLMG
jgi:hypothetical protein